MTCNGVSTCHNHWGKHQGHWPKDKLIEPCHSPKAIGPSAGFTGTNYVSTNYRVKKGGAGIMQDSKPGPEEIDRGGKLGGKFS